jgi:hypothetical protein
MLYDGSIVIDSLEDMFYGQLVTESNGPVAYQSINAYLNETLLDLSLTTDGDGCFSFERNFNPAEEELYYMLQVSFEGTGSQEATLNATDLMGGSYTVCQTIQFDYMPSSNTTSITIEPQATQVTVPTKIPEEIQREAVQSGQLEKKCYTTENKGRYLPKSDILGEMS